MNKLFTSQFYDKQKDEGVLFSTVRHVGIFTCLTCFLEWSKFYKHRVLLCVLCFFGFEFQIATLMLPFKVEFKFYIFWTLSVS